MCKHFVCRIESYWLGIYCHWYMKNRHNNIRFCSLILLVSSVGLLHFVSFTALIGIAYRHTPVRLSLVSNPLFRGFLSLDTSPTKKATIKVALLLVSSVGFEPATLWLKVKRTYWFYVIFYKAKFNFIFVFQIVIDKSWLCVIFNVRCIHDVKMVIL